MEKVTVFIDYESLSTVLQREKLQIDLLALRDYLGEGRVLTEVFCYPGLISAQENELWDSLTLNGFLVRFQPGDNLFKGDTSITFH